mmetsp:Transcript_11184/g.12269  ORF Transcript_11184/g.12269 Transcript_11184/m.12269 type:complete len:339 (-) Transcript_11184:220-1236(-)|eukprot:CAMPEP_0114991436 /NCGR_PEP_ID=MMETSP0216-20121206/11371_1 /TAXON_ID=223996 /ORGANISM="Protocruzia adherens, Strain Boccale" /LENGTH=338 /DNA_ID=CAMNT_0002354763 /DNA_START=36 /DNA_END=1052 /DNA_ORIENTATION=+
MADTHSNRDIDLARLKNKIHRLPKVELHAHLNGSIPRAFVQQLCQSRGIEWPTILDEQVNLQSAMDMFSAIHKLIDSQEILTRLCSEVFSAFAEDNVAYLEIRTTPKGIPGSDVTIDSYLRCVLESIEATEQAYEGRIQIRLLVSINRTSGVESAREILNLVKKMKSSHYIVGVDFSGNPNGPGFCEYAEIFQEFRDMGYKIAIHFAEVQNDQDSLDILKFKPDRLGHGIFVDGPVKEEMLKSRIPLEICPSSNSVCSDRPIEEHHFKDFYPEDYPLCICTDDFGIFGSNLTDEIVLIARHHNLTPTDVKALMRKTVDFIFDNSCKAVLKVLIDGFLV